MKILFVTPQLPYPPDKGATIRTFALIKGLARNGHEIHLLSFINSEADREALPALQPYCTRVTTVLAPQRSTLTRLRRLLFSSWPDMAWRLPSQELADKLSAALAEGYDVVQVESIEVAQYALQVVAERDAGGQKKPIVVFDDLNAEYVLQQRAWELDRAYPRRWHKALYSWVQWRRLRRYEEQVCATVDHVLAVSDRDAATIGAMNKDIKVSVVTNGVDCAFFSASKSPVPQPPIQHMASLVFTGTMDFRPNIDAVLWFAQDILPLIKREVFHVHFYIVGKNPPAEVRALASPALTVTGYVKDIRPYIAESAVYVVPMRIGSGTKLKVLEAMAMRIPVVSTTIGAEGIAVTAGDDILICDTPADFAHQTAELLSNAEQRRRLAANGRRLVESRYDWHTIVPALEQVYAEAGAA